jgi:predicted DNA-binding transcriptional regulator AlpA
MSVSTKRLLRLPSIIGPGGPICVSRSTWLAGVKSGRFPAPVKLGPRITAWRQTDIERLVENGVDIVRHPPLSTPADE